MDQKINMFVIYAREDKSTKLNLLRHLNQFKEAFNLFIWHDDQIEPGQLWKPHIESRLNHTDIFLLLVSVDFMNSQFIRQTEFKAAIDRHKENKSVVIPVIIDYCQWDIDFRLIDYTFNIKQLQVLPEEGRPIGDWNTPDKAYNNVAAGVRKVLTSIKNKNKQQESKEKKENKETTVKIKAEEDKSLKEEAEAKIKAAQDKRLKEEAEAKIKVTEDKRLKEEAESKIKAAEEKRLKEETESKIKAAEEKRLKEEAEAKRKTEEEQRLKEKAETKRKAAEEQRLKEAAPAKRKAEEEKLAKKNKFIKFGLVGVIVFVLIVVGLFVFIPNNLDPKITPADNKPSIVIEKTKIDVPIKKEIEIGAQANSIKKADSLKIAADLIRKTDSIEKAIVLRKTDSIKKAKEDYFLGLRVGDSLQGGIIFTIDHSSKTGKIAYPKDFDKMTWTNAEKYVVELAEGWRLPTFDELVIMYGSIGQGNNNSGQFADKLYWSSTPFAEYQARLLHFRDGNKNYSYNKQAQNRKYLFRVIRDFSLEY
jgi:hypothetical protein